MVCGAVLREASLYEILGVDDDASEEQIKSAFRSKAKELHPDVNKAVRLGTHSLCYLSNCFS